MQRPLANHGQNSLAFLKCPFTHSQNDPGDLRGVAGGDGELGCLCGEVMALPIHLGAWSMLWLPFELLLFATMPNLYFAEHISTSQPISQKGLCG